MHRLGRRRFLATMGGAGASLLPGGRVPVAGAQTDPVLAGRPLVRYPEKTDLILLTARPAQLETPLRYFDRAITPNDAFFVRSHHSVPDLDAREHRLEIGGEVARPFALSLAELRKLPSIELVCVLECAGNGRGLMKLANTSGTQWGLGAVGTARWKGVRLAELLERAGADPTAQHVWLDAADRGILPNVPPFPIAVWPW